MPALTDHLNASTIRALEYEENGHDYVDSSFTPTAGRTYYKMVVQVACTDITYTDRGGTEHANVALPVVGDVIYISGAAPTIAGSGKVRASIDTP